MKHSTVLAFILAGTTAHLDTRQGAQRDFLIANLTINTSTRDPSTHYSFQASQPQGAATRCSAIVPPGPNNQTICANGKPITALTGMGSCNDKNWQWKVSTAEIPGPAAPPKRAFQFEVKHVDNGGLVFTACRLIPVTDFACEAGQGGNVVVKYVGDKQFDMQAADHECYQK